MNQKERDVGTAAQNHFVGQIENNLYKVKRALQKTQFAGEIDEAALQKGTPQAILKIMHHLLFRASERFTSHIHNGASRTGANVHEDLKFMPDMQFFQNVCLILCDLFGYRTNLTPKQFFQEGYAERKLILLLDIYDILKKTRESLKVNDKLAV